MTITISALALEVLGSGVMAVIIGAFVAIQAFGDDHFIRIGRHVFAPPEFIFTLAALLFWAGVLAVIISSGIAIGVRFK